MRARIVHIEVAGRNGEVLEGFYGKLFEWKIVRESAGGNQYGRFQFPGGLTGGIRHEPAGNPEVLFYAEVSDLDAAFERACALGGTARIPPMKHGELRFALVQDPEGNSFGMIEASA